MTSTQPMITLKLYTPEWIYFWTANWDGSWFMTFMFLTRASLVKTARYRFTSKPPRSADISSSDPSSCTIPVLLSADFPTHEVGIISTSRVPQLFTTNWEPVSDLRFLPLLFFSVLTLYSMMNYSRSLIELLAQLFGLLRATKLRFFRPSGV